VIFVGKKIDNKQDDMVIKEIKKRKYFFYKIPMGNRELIISNNKENLKSII
jgi:hypothetical protein